MLKNIIKKLKEKKGINSIQMAMSSLMVIAVITCMVDFIIISNRMQNISSTINYISRVMSNQGCLANTPETSCKINSESGIYKIEYIKNKKFVKSSELYETIKSMMNSDGIKDSEWRVYIDGQLLTPSTVTKTFDFKSKIPIEVQIDYRWTNLSNILPVNESTLSGTFNSQIFIVSTYKVRAEDGNIGFDYYE